MVVMDRRRMRRKKKKTLISSIRESAKCDGYVRRLGRGTMTGKGPGSVSDFWAVTLD